MHQTVEVATDKTSRDRRNKELQDYPRPSVAVDTAVLTQLPDESDPAGRLVVLQIRRSGSHRHGDWALPGTFLHPGERLADAVGRSLREKVGIAGVAPRQLLVFDDPTRDERGWVLSVAHVDLVPFLHVAGIAAERDDVRLVPVERAGPLPYDHEEIVAEAVAAVRARYAEAPDPDRLLPRTFTLRQLRMVHEGIAGTRLQKDNFRRLMEPRLLGTGRTTSGERGRPAELFSRR
jgi:ADP-ribose pyrophosphatase YjhB (NUDIX family)